MASLGEQLERPVERVWTGLERGAADALGLVMQDALRHRDACRRLAQHVELGGGLLQELMMRREATRRPLAGPALGLGGRGGLLGPMSPRAAQLLSP
jgi:hypothetical protein